MQDNPYRASDRTQLSTEDESVDEISTGKAAYNVVSDTVMGVNLRGSDNRFQAKFIAASVIVLGFVGAVVTYLNPRWQLPWYAGALAGGSCGLVLGVLLSGTLLMIFRGYRHIRGMHD